MKYFFLSFFFVPFFCYSQIEISANSGFLTGAPIGPADEGDKGFIETAPSFGLALDYRVKKNLSFSIGIKLSNKKGSYDAVAEGDTVFALELPNQPPALFPTTYKGRVMGNFNNAYLEFPILANIKWKRSITCIGFYQGILISGSHQGNVDLVLGNNFSKIQDKFNDSKYLNIYDIGVCLGGEFEIITNVLNLGYIGSYGLRSVFSKEYPNVKDRFSNFYINTYLKMRLF